MSGPRGVGLSRPLTMVEVGKLMGVSAEEAKLELRRIERSLRVRIVLKPEGSKQARCWTTMAILKRHAPHVVDYEPEALRAVQELRAMLREQLDQLREELADFRTEANRRLNSAGARCRRLESEVAALRENATVRRRTSRARARRGTRKGPAGSNGAGPDAARVRER